ncbi:MAG: hypothetical protein DRH17_14080 [Deltaproteobacteria bacterium]|nr:MAG: hypothetical protein DRH17_14080 [Deltaproteobacteria bacterium]
MIRSGSGVNGEIEVIVLDKNGKEIHREKRPMDSFTRNIKNLLTMFDTGGWLVSDVNGSSVTFMFKNASDEYLYNAEVLAPSGNDDYGILVGSSDTAFDVYQHSLGAKISHGTGSGQLSYGETSVVDFGDDYKTWQRAFDNLSGSDIVVREIGMFAKVTREESGVPTPYYVMLARDVITTTTVPNGGRLIVKYTFKINP